MNTTDQEHYLVDDVDRLYLLGKITSDNLRRMGVWPEMLEPKERTLENMRTWARSLNDQYKRVAPWVNR